MIRKTTWYFLAAFAVVLAFAFFFQRAQDRSEVEATPTAGITFLLDTQASSIAELRLEDANGNVVAVERGGEEGWMLIEPQGEPADVARIESAIIQAESLRILDSLESEPDLAAIGLDPPEYRLTVTLEGGAQQTALVGKATPTGSGYYARLENGPLEIVNKFSLDGVLEILSSPPVRPTEEATLGPDVTGTAPPEE